MILPLLAALTLVIASAKIGGWLSSRLGQPVVLGKLVVGLLLGPSLFNVFEVEYFQQAHVVAALREFGELGVIFLMFVAGLEINLLDLARAGKPAALAGLLGVIAPLVLGTLTVLPFGYSLTQAVFLGIAMAATSVSISAQTLIELGRLRSREGLTMLGAAVFDDVLVIGVLAAFVALTAEGAPSVLGLIGVFARMALFLAGALTLGAWLLPRLVRWVEEHRLPVSEPVISLVVIVILLFAWTSEYMGGVAAITGAFIAGVSLSASASRDKIERGIRIMAYAFFVPVFLVSIGLTADARSLTAEDAGLVIVVCLVAVVSKLVGAGGGAKLGGLGRREALRVGVGMISRGEVGLIVASVGVDAGIIGSAGITAAVLMVLVTTLVTPPLLRLVFRPATEAGEVTHA